MLQVLLSSVTDVSINNDIYGSVFLLCKIGTHSAYFLYLMGHNRHFTGNILAQLRRLRLALPHILSLNVFLENEGKLLIRFTQFF